jgi:hypothetical protein
MGDGTAAEEGEPHGESTFGSVGTSRFKVIRTEERLVQSSILEMMIRHTERLERSRIRGSRGSRGGRRRVAERKSRWSDVDHSLIREVDGSSFGFVFEIGRSSDAALRAERDRDRGKSQESLLPRQGNGYECVRVEYCPIQARHRDRVQGGRESERERVGDRKRTSTSLPNSTPSSCRT